MAVREASSSTYKLGSDDRISPFKVAVLVLVREYCSARLAQLGLTPHAQASYSEKAPFTDQQCKDFCLLSLELIQSYDVTWEDFQIFLEPHLYNIHPTVVSEFVKNLHQVVKDGTSGLLDLEESLEKLLMEPAKGKPMIRRDSVLGIFIRKMVLQLDKMTFEATNELSKNLAAYVDKTKPVSDDPLEMVQVSRKQAELIVSQQLNMLQRSQNLAYCPVSLQKIIDKILQENKDFAEANYLAHLNEMRCQDFGQAEKKLHMAYDQGTVSAKGLIHSKMDDNLMNNKSFRHATLNLAFLHASFGHVDLAINALNETISLSGEAVDRSCLQESLAWLCHLEEDPATRTKMMERLVTISSEFNLHYLASLGLAMWTQECALVGTMPPHKIFEYVHAGDVANCQHSLTDMMLASLALRAALWNFYGFPQNALQVSQLLLALHTGDPTKGNIYYNNENVHAAVCNVALHLARQGRYGEAELVTRFAASQYAHFQQRSNMWKLTDLHVAFYRTLWLGQWDRAESITLQLAVFDQTESLVKKAHLLLCKGDNCQSESILTSLERKLSSPVKRPAGSNRLTNPGWRISQKLRLQVQSLLLKAVLLCARQNYASALEQISKASDVCTKHYMMLELALISLQSAEIQLQMNLVENALALVKKHFNTICTHGSLFEQGLATLLFAKCLLVGCNRGENSVKNRAQKSQIFPLLNKARAIFDRVEAFHLVKDVVFLEASLYHHMGNERERNTRAMLFRQLDDQYPLKTSHGILIFIGL